jgi:hypothetical protein
MNNLWFIIDNICKWMIRIGAILLIAIILIAGIYIITFFIIVLTKKILSGELKELYNWRKDVLKKKKDR